MTDAPIYSIDPKAFFADPYPTYAALRKEAPIAYVPELDAVLFTRREDISVYEKMTEIFSSEQPDGLMNKLMGINMMRKDGDPHLVERRATFPSLSPKTARDVWKCRIEDAATGLIEVLRPEREADVLAAFAAPLSGEMLKEVTGLRHVTWQDIDRWSQAMIEGIANYADDPEIEATCKAAVSEINAAVQSAPPTDAPTLINAQQAAGLSTDQITANIRLAISGGQNETRDAIGGLIWALLAHPEERAKIDRGEKSYRDAFDEYVRWIAPIGMSPRRVAQDATVNGVSVPEGARVFFMFASANRDETVFETPDAFNLDQDPSRHIAFGAGPHFCAGAPVAKTVVADIALPLFFRSFPQLSLTTDVVFEGWAFRGPTRVMCGW